MTPDFARLHPRGFYVTDTRACPRRAAAAVCARARLRVPPLKRSDELVVFQKCADIGAAYEVHRDWSETRVCALTAYDSDDDDMRAAFYDFAGYYHALATIQ
jgi:hypothetical protein